MNINKVLSNDYENKRLFRRAENKPNQTQFQTFCCGILYPDNAKTAISRNLNCTVVLSMVGKFISGARLYAGAGR